MNSVGIDVSKGKSMVAVVRPMKTVVAKPFEVHHTIGGLSRLADYIKGLDGDTRVIMENTGRYYEPMAQKLYEAGIFVSAVNPLLIRGYGNNSLRKVKTDKADSLKIARYGLDNWSELRQYTGMDLIRYQLKYVYREFCLYVKIRTSLKNNLISILDQTFPGVNEFFSSPARQDGTQKWVDFALAFWHAECVRRLSRSAFTEKYRRWCKKHKYNFNAAKAGEIHEKSKGLVPMLPQNDVTKMLVQESIRQFNVVSKSVELFRGKMNELASQLPEYSVVKAMYGVGDSLGPQLMAEIGDVRRFAHRGSLAAFAGVDPGPKQSGMYDAKSTKATKRGSPQLRRILFLIMTILLQKAPPDNPVYRFLDKKRSEGKPYLVYMTAGANKFLRIYYGKVKEYLDSMEK